VYSFVPREVLTRLDIAPHSAQRFRLADGSSLERQRGDALFIDEQIDDCIIGHALVP
jgi:hypothetical protein